MSGVPTPRRARRAGGFTLLEMLAVVVLTAVVMTAAARLFLQVSDASVAQAEATREVRRTTLLLDRVARDLESASLVVKPPDVDPLAHPWLFLAESRQGGDGADRLRFTTRSHVPRASAVHESDLALVSYFLALPEDGSEGYVLYRGVSPRLPEGLSREFPRVDDEGVQPLAEDVASFSVRLLDEEGGWDTSWDSSTVERSSELPVAAEITVALLAGEDEAPRPLSRYVELPVRPLDLAAELEAGAEGAASGDEDEDGDGIPDDEEALAEESGEDCVTVGQCVARNPEAFGLLLQDNPQLGAVIDSLRDQCFATQGISLPVPVEGCQ